MATEQTLAALRTDKDPPSIVEVTTNGTSKGPRFAHYFGPVLDALRELGGKASPKDVMEHVRDHVHVSKEELQGLNKGGQTKFENKVAWARFYMVKAGLVGAKQHGIWSLTSEGQETELDYSTALKIFHDVQSQFKTAKDVENEDSSPPDIETANELFDDPKRQFWFVGASWGKDSNDQTGRFLSEGIWENGYGNDGKFSHLVKQMRPGDKIAIKAAANRKNGLPFENRGKFVSYMRIKASGTIVEQTVDGKTVKVDWQPILNPPKIWYFYTYRQTVWKMDASNDYARRLILFSFTDMKQDYKFWLEQPHWKKEYGLEANPSIDQVTAEEDEGFGADLEKLCPYTVSEIMADGCFVEQSELENALFRLDAKKNLILQGPPGTGKTWLANGVRPSRAEMATDQIARHDADDLLMVSLARLVFDHVLPTENIGTNAMSEVGRDEVMVRSLFEKAVGNFFKLELPDGWHVSQGNRLQWPVSVLSLGMKDILPGMQTDIILDHHEEKRRIIIDTKFTNVLTRSQHGSDILKSGYIYQIYAYLRSQENESDALSMLAEGLMLHPAVGLDVDEAAIIQGHRIRFATIDLSLPSEQVIEKLRAIPLQTNLFSV